LADILEPMYEAFIINFFNTRRYAFNIFRNVSFFTAL